MTTIRELLALRAVVPQVYAKAAAVEHADPNLLYGVELEIENVDYPDDFVTGIGSITHVEDGSLRNQGREFITVPMNFTSLHHALTLFFNKAKLNDRNYSDRTSVHVHCNVQDLTVEQLVSVLLLYQVYEGLFYSFVGHDRDKNIFCVPWAETNLTFNILCNLNSANSSKILGLKAWQKYTGVNLLPIFTQGTIEFRQMPGTCDLPHISNWLNLIGSLFAYARNNTLEAIKDRFIKLNTTSSYRPLTEDVFKQWSPLLFQQNNYWNLMEDGVLNMKYLLIEEKNPKNNKAKLKSADIIPDRFIINWGELNQEREARDRPGGFYAAQLPLREAAFQRGNVNRNLYGQAEVARQEARLPGGNNIDPNDDGTGF